MSRHIIIGSQSGFESLPFLLRLLVGQAWAPVAERRHFAIDEMKRTWAACSNPCTITGSAAPARIRNVESHHPSAGVPTVSSALMPGALTLTRRGSLSHSRAANGSRWLCAHLAEDAPHGGVDGTSITARPSEPTTVGIANTARRVTYPMGIGFAILEMR